MKSNVFLFCLAICSFISVKAQSGMSLFADQTAEGQIHLKWIQKSVDLSLEYKLYRSVNQANPEQIAVLKAAKPLSDKEMADKSKLTGVSKWRLLYSYLVNEAAKDPESKDLMFGELMIQAITENELASELGMYYKDTKVEKGNTYKYSLYTIKASKETLVAETSLKVQSQPETLAAPDLYLASAVKNGVEIGFSTNKLAPVYEITRTPGNSRLLILSEEQWSLSREKKGFYTDKDSNFMPGQKFEYQVRAMNYLGRFSENSKKAVVTIVDLTPPNPALSVDITHNADRQLVLKWKPSTSRDISTQEVYRQTLNGKPEKVGVVSKNEYIDGKVAEGETYEYWIETLDKSGNRTKSEKVRYTLPDATPPVKPEGLTANATSGLIGLKWKANNEKDLMGYLVFRSITENKEDFNLLTVKPISATEFTDSLPPQNGNDFYYRILAVDKSYNRGPFSQVKARMPDIVAPSSVSLQGEVKEKDVILNWTKAADEDLASYVVYLEILREDEGYTKPQALDSVSATTYTWTAKGNGVFRFSVVSVDRAGNRSELSNYRTMWVKQQKVVQANTPQAQYSKSDQSVKLTWKAETDVVYQVWRQLPDENWMPISNLNTENSFTDSDVPKMPVVTYKIRLFNADGEFTDSGFVQVKTSPE